MIQFTQITPEGWNIDTVHYVHKGDSDGSRPNHRPLALVEAFRKIITSIIYDRMKRDFTRLEVPDPTNPGFQAGRTTANSIFPLRAAAEHCPIMTETEFSTLLGDLKWCFDTPASTVIEIGLMRLGVLDFYTNLLRDIYVHIVRSTITAHGKSVDITGRCRSSEDRLAPHPKGNTPARAHARPHARTQGGCPHPGPFRGALALPSRTRGGARSLARSRARAVAARTVTAAAAAAAAAATDDTRDDGRGDDPPPAPPSGTGACQPPPPPPRRSTTASPPSSSHFCPLSRPLSRRARGRVSGTPIIRPSVRMTAHCARAAHDPPPPPRARARERARPRPPSGDIATRRHDDANLGWQAAAAVPRLTEPPNPNPNPNDARKERMTREPAHATSPNPPPHARERARPTPPPRPPPRRRDPHATQHTTHNTPPGHAR